MSGTFRRFMVLLFVGLLMSAIYSVAAGDPGAEAAGQRLPAIASADPRSWDVSEAKLGSGPTGAVTLKEALDLAMQHSPRLVAQEWMLLAAHARRRQAGVRANPELDVEVENVGGKGPLRNFDAAETTIALANPISLSGVRGKKKRLAAQEVELGAWELEIARLDVVAEVKQRFAEMYAAQERLGLSDELVQLQESTLKAVSERVAAGKSAPPEEIRAEVTLADARVKRERARRDLEAARYSLAATWGSDAPVFTEVTGDFRAVVPPPGNLDIAALVSRSPDVAGRTLEAERLRAAVNLERALRVPELTVAGGARHFKETGDVAWVMGLSVPLPLFDRNQGAVRAAQCERAAADAEVWGERASVHAALVGSLQGISAAYIAVKEYDKTILPGAERAFDAVLEGYRSGKFSYLEVLDSQRTFFEARSGYTDALEDYHRSKAELERAIGAELEAMAGDDDR